MKKFTFVFSALVTFALSLAPSAKAFELHHNFTPLTVLTGRPDYGFPELRHLVFEGFALVPQPDSLVGTQVASILYDEGMRGITLVEILNFNGATNTHTVLEGLRIGASRSPVVTYAVGGSAETNNFMCGQAARWIDTAFVISAPSSSGRLSADLEPECMARNILRVAALNRAQDDLASFSSFGETIRLAAPGVGLRTRSAGGGRSTISGTTPAASIAAARLANYAQLRRQLHGEALIEAFLNDETEILPNLNGKVEGARAIRSR